MTADEDFRRYLQEPCDEEGCDFTATHNQRGRRVCNSHIDDGLSAPPAFARND